MNPSPLTSLQDDLPRISHSEADSLQRQMSALRDQVAGQRADIEWLTWELSDLGLKFDLVMELYRDLAGRVAV